MNFRSIAIAASALFLLLTSIAEAGTPAKISYQGRVTNGSGFPVADGAYLIKFQLYDAASGGNLLWNSNFQSVSVVGGLYAYILGADVPFPDGLFSGKTEVWLGVTVGVDPELAPRKQLLSAPFSFKSLNADSVDWGGVRDVAVSSAQIIDGQIVNADISSSAAIAPGKISGTAATLGGTNLFAAANQFNGTLQVCDSTIRMDCNGISIGRNFTPSSNYLVYARRDVNTGASRYGIMVDLRNSGTGWVYGSYSQARASTAGAANTGRVFGSYSLSESDNDFRFGSYSTTSATTSSLSTGDSYGSYCTAYDGLNSHGVYGLGTSANYGFGLYGEATNNTFGGFGVYGESHSNGYGIAVRGWSHGYPITSISYGVFGGSSQSGHGIGVYGEAEQNSGNGTAVYGYANNNGGNNWGGYFVGDVNVTGTIFSPVIVTRLDHPLDPENRYLQFSGVDSPEMTSVISGNVVTDNLGKAEIAVPGYFVAIASNPRYQLTVIGDFAQAIVSRELNESGFAIRTDKPNMKVSWQITVTRKDAFAKHYRVPTEVAKTGDEVGTYRFPEAFGQPESRGVDYIQWLQTKAITDAEKKRSATAGSAVSEQVHDPASLE